MNLDQLVHDSITRQVDGVAPPPPDLSRIRSRGRTKARMRSGLAASGVGLGLAAAGALAVLQFGGDARREPLQPASVGQLSFSEGLRAFSSQDGETMYLGGNQFPIEAIDGLDTEAVVTPEGLVYASEGQKYLLTDSGASYPLGAPAPGGAQSGYSSIVKYDATSSLVACGFSTWTVAASSAASRCPATRLPVSRRPS